MSGTGPIRGTHVALARDPGKSACGLSEAECRSCAALPEHRRADWRASRLAAKRAAAAALGVPESRLRAEPPRPGAPAGLLLIDGRGRATPAPVSLSVSHRNGLGAAVAVQGEERLGIDVERQDAVPEAAARYFMTAAERTEATHLAATTLWSLKEAAWKAVGCGGEIPFKELRLRFEGGGRLRAVEAAGRSVRAAARISTPWPGYVVAVVRVHGKGR